MYVLVFFVDVDNGVFGGGRRWRCFTAISTRLANSIVTVIATTGATLAQAIICLFAVLSTTPTTFIRDTRYRKGQAGRFFSLCSGMVSTHRTRKLSAPPADDTPPFKTATSGLGSRVLAIHHSSRFQARAKERRFVFVLRCTLYFSPSSFFFFFWVGYKKLLYYNQVQSLIKC